MDLDNKTKIVPFRMLRIQIIDLFDFVQYVIPLKDCVLKFTQNHLKVRELDTTKAKFKYNLIYTYGTSIRTITYTNWYFNRFTKLLDVNLLEHEIFMDIYIIKHIVLDKWYLISPNVRPKAAVT